MNRLTIQQLAKAYEYSCISLEEFAEELHNRGYYPSSIKYDFGPELNITEDITIVGNTKKW